MLEDFSIRDLVTVAISLCALAVSYGTAMRASRLNAQQYELVKRQGEAENRIGAAQAELAREQTRMQRDSDIIRWAGETAGVLSEMAELAVARDEAFSNPTRWRALRHQLATKIDVGRLYFPNYADDLVNLHKPPAYRGVRQKVIDHLVWAFEAFGDDVLHGDDAAQLACKQQIIAEKRLFISEVHEFIDPNRYVEFRDSDAIDAIKAELDEQKAELDRQKEPAAS